MKLHLDPRSSSCMRVLCCLAYKGVEFERVTVGLMKNEHLAESFRALNPAALVPALELDDGSVLTQSLAIIEWLDASYPAPPVFPSDERTKAAVRAVCGFVASEIHAVTNMRIRKEIERLMGDRNDAAMAWCRRWTEQGLQSLENGLQASAARFCFGDDVSAADFFVAPMMLNAQRYGCDLRHFETLDRVYRHCLAHPAFASVNAAGSEDRPTHETTQRKEPG